MSRYDSLKDYIEFNNKDIVFHELNRYLEGQSNTGICELNKNDIAIHTLAWNGFNSENLSKRYITFTIGISIELKKITIAAPSFIITT